jgi:hypothetical protein
LWPPLRASRPLRHDPPETTGAGACAGAGADWDGVSPEPELDDCCAALLDDRAALLDDRAALLDDRAALLAAEVAACPRNACSASSERKPAIATAPASIHRLSFESSSSPASRVEAVGGIDCLSVGRGSKSALSAA